MKAKYAGLKTKDIRWDPEKAAKAVVELRKYTGFDISLCASEIRAVQKDAGQEMKEPEDGTATPISNFYLTAEDVDSKDLFDPLDPKQTPWMNKGIFDKLKIVKSLLGDDAVLIGPSTNVFTLSGLMRGTEVFLMDLFTEPELAKKIIAKSERLVEGYNLRSLEIGADIALLADPSASEDLISADTFREFVFEPTQRIIRNLKSAYKKPAMSHICGDTRNICRFMPEMGIDIFSFDSKVDISHYKKEIGDKVVVAGNVPTITVLMDKTPEVVMEHTRVCIEKAAPGGGYMIAPACEFPRETPLENLVAIRKAAEKYSAQYQ